MAATDVGTGISIAFQSGFFAEVLDVRVSGMHRDAIETTHGTSTNGWRTFIPSDLMDMGQLEVDLNFNADATPPIDTDAESVTIVFPVPSGLSNGAQMQGIAFMTDMDGAFPIDDRMTASFTLKYSGAPTWADAS